jgi:hypothetical protein
MSQTLMRPARPVARMRSSARAFCCDESVMVSTVQLVLRTAYHGQAQNHTPDSPDIGA